MSRTCGTCTLCCKLMKIAALKKPVGQWCPHCAVGQGCTIYAGRPPECAAFTCVWLSTPALGEEWKPARSKIVLVYDARNNHLVAHVEAGNAAALKKSPYREKLQDWMKAALPRGGRVYLAVGGQMSLLLPDGEHALGVLEGDDLVDVRQDNTPMGPRWHVTVRKPKSSDDLPRR
jgi:hypothetical protein